MKNKSTYTKHGNSHGIVIPKPVRDDPNFTMTLGDLVKIDVNDDGSLKIVKQVISDDS